MTILDLIKALYGPRAISSTIGTRTNVIRLPSGKLQKYISKDLNIEAASDAAAQNAYNEMKELIPEVAKMNDAEKLIFEGNLRRLKNKLEDSGLIQKENVSSGIVAIQSKIDELKQAGKELEKVTGEKATLTDVLNDLGASQVSMSKINDEGLVRATARQILINDIKAGKIKNITVEEAINMGEPLDPFRQIYGEGALEQLDSLIPNFRNLKTEVEAEKLARSKFKFEPDEARPKESYTKEEMDKILKEGETESKGLDYLTGVTREVETQPEGTVIPFRKKPTEPEGKADGGIIGRREMFIGGFLSKLINSNPQIISAIKAQQTPSDMPLTLQERYRKYLSEAENTTTNNSSPKPLGLIENFIKGSGVAFPQTTTSINDQLYNLYRASVDKKADGGRIGFKTGGGKKILDLISKAKNPIKQFTDDEMISYIKKYKEEGPTLEEFTNKVNAETGSNFTPEQLEHAHRVKVAYPHSTPIVDSQGKFIGGGLYNPPLDVSISDREALTESIMKTRKAKGLDVPKKEVETLSKAGEGKFTKQQVLEKIIQKTIDANPTDEYVQKTFPNFIKEIRANPELAKSENVWNTFTQDFPENKRLVVYGDDTVDFFTKGENLPEGMRQTQELANTYGISMEEATKIKQMEPTDQVMEIKKLQVLKKRTENANGGRIGYAEGGLTYLMGL